MGTRRARVVALYAAFQRLEAKIKERSLQPEGLEALSKQVAATTAAGGKQILEAGGVKSADAAGFRSDEVRADV